MLLSNAIDGPRPKAIVSINRLANFVSKEEPPSKTEPFKTAAEVSPGHSLSLIVASKDGSNIDLPEMQSTLSYCKVYMKLLDIITGDFFNDYIKTNDIAMRSEGRANMDNLYTLADGVLRLEVDKPTFERLGLEGTPIQGAGQKHMKARYAVELNLRAPAMVSGRKGFDRVVRAFTEVLTESHAWLFYNLKNPVDFSGPIAAFQPLIRTMQPTIETISDSGRPDLSQVETTDYEGFTEVLEWLSMVALRSPRTRIDDKIDPFLCRYSLPEWIDTQTLHDLQLIIWKGFLHKTFVKTLLISLLRQAQIDWFAITLDAFDGSYTILKTQNLVIVANTS